MPKKGPGHQDQDTRTPGPEHQDTRTRTPGRKKKRPIRPLLYDHLFFH
jgi:hypothetical protein